MNENNSGFMSHSGGLELQKMHEDGYSCSSVVKAIHLDAGKILYGGYWSTIAYSALGKAAHIVSNKRCVTITLEIKFISVALLNETLTGKVIIKKKTRSLVFINCEIFNSGGIVIIASGIWKIL